MKKKHIYYGLKKLGVCLSFLFAQTVTAQQHVVSSSTTWNSSNLPPSAALTNGFVVNPGVTLTIDGITLNMSNDVSIDVMSNYTTGGNTTKGGILIIQRGAKISGTRWEGIEVWGQADKSQLSIVKPMAQLKIDNSTIEGCRAIKNYDDRGPGNIDANSYGGIIIGNQAIFHNSGSIMISNYKNNFPSPNKYIDQSRFTRCTFISDAISPTTYSAYNYVLLKNVRGINFIGCSFTDNLSSSTRYGIIGDDASFTVDRYCDGVVFPSTCTNMVPCTFNVANGITCFSGSANTYNMDKITIKNSVFNCNNPITLGGSYAPEIGFNTMNMTTANGYIGIYTQNCTDLDIYENSLQVTNNGSGTHQLFGIVTITSGMALSKVTKNTISNFNYGTESIGYNRNPGSTNIGLLYACNVFTNSTAQNRDMYIGPKLHYVDTRYPLDNSTHGIAQNQGITTGTAGNVFSAKSGLPVNSTNHILNQGDPVNYFYYSGSTLQDPVYSNVTKYSSTTQNPCSSRVTGETKPRIPTTPIFDLNTVIWAEGVPNPTAVMKLNEVVDSFVRYYSYTDDSTSIDMEGIKEVFKSTSYGIDYQIALAGIYTQEKQYDSAQIVLNNILSNYTLELDSNITASVNNLITMIGIYEQLNAVGSWNSLSSTTKQTVRDIASTDLLFGADGAKSLLRQNEDSIFKHVVITVDSLGNYTSRKGSPYSQTEIFNIRIYPNPVDEGLFVDIPSELSADKLVIQDITGKMIDNIKLNEGSNQINLSKLTTGIYFLRVYSDNHVITTQKISKL